MPQGGSGGIFLLLTESFAVRAMLGSLLAAGLVYLALRTIGISNSRARRLLCLAPITAAAVAAIISFGEAFLPRMWVTSTASGQAPHILELLGEPWFLAPQRDLDVLLIFWALIAGALLTRRAVGALAVRRLLGRATTPIGYGELVPVIERLAASLRIRSPELLVLPSCPGGALTTRTRRPVVVVDPLLLEGLDARETEGLLAHELAHIRRRDNLLAAATGAFRDLAWFLPPVHLAARWLRSEREESADELASAHTRRPGALASSILKVWDASRPSGRSLACAAVPVRSLALPGGGNTSPNLAVIQHRIDRLMERPQEPSCWRRRAEIGVAGMVTAAAVSAAVAVPAWMVRQYDAAAFAVGYLAAPPTDEVEAPAFATFRQLAPDTGTSAAVATDVVAVSGSPGVSACPCVESRTQLRDRTPATGTLEDGHMAWGAPDRAAWHLEASGRQAGARDARPLLTVSDPAQHVGFFVLGASP